MTPCQTQADIRAASLKQFGAYRKLVTAASTKADKSRDPCVTFLYPTCCCKLRIVLFDLLPREATQLRSAPPS